MASVSSSIGFETERQFYGILIMSCFIVGHAWEKSGAAAPAALA
jgi:hypothetical protein